MSQTEFVAFLAIISGTTALGIDLIIPTFGDVRPAFGLPADSTQIALAVSVYFLGLSVGQIFYGPIADRFGRKPLLLAALGLYACGALASALSGGLMWLLISRLLWGLGAAGPKVLIMTIARDIYSGDQLAKVLTQVAAIFMVVPAVAPLLGQAILQLSNWRVVFGAPLVPALGLVLWSILRLEETLAPSARRPLTFANTGQAFRAVIGNRTALGYSLALLFDFASFASFLAVSELLFERVYDRSSQFPLFFGAMSAFMGITAFTGSRVIGRFGASRMIRILLMVTLLSSTILFVLSVLGAGAPNIWLWFGLLTITNSLRAIVNPLAGSEAMQSMGHLAGTAASLMGTISMGGGALLAIITDRFIRDSVTPLSAAYMVFGALELAVVIWATKARRSAIA